jgi:hemerythrin-like domain-containing protein
MDDPQSSRRRFLHHAGGAGLLLGFAGCAREGGQAVEDHGQGGGVCAGEDLMREHGVLNRILLIYEEGVRRLRTGEDLDPADLAAAAGIIRQFIEDYHERLEEEELFPRFEAANRLRDLVGVLRVQHDAGRWLTAEILSLARADRLNSPEARGTLSERMLQFVRMYRPHEAREDTVLFPELHRLLSPRDLDALGDRFEEREQQLFGKDGFEGMVLRTTKIEERLGLYDLSRFTPKP